MYIYGIIYIYIYIYIYIKEGNQGQRNATQGAEGDKRRQTSGASGDGGP